MKRKIFLFLAIVSVVGMVAISGCKKKETYTVTFNPNGGTGTMAAQTFTEGEAQALIRNTFTNDGYTFTGWNTVQGGSGASYTDGQTITATADMTLYAQWTSNGTNPTPGPDPTPTPTNTLNGHEFVDLGLPSGLLWATCNVGANTPEEYGDYFAWGETTPKDTYTWINYRFRTSGYNWENVQFNKYNTQNRYGPIDNLTTLEATDDAATANWGTGWRMPDDDELSELRSICACGWTTQNGVNGFLFTGPNGNSIFLPAAGGRRGSELYDAGSFGVYKSSSLSDTPYRAWVYLFDSGYYRMGYGDRYSGSTVRPVCVLQN